jgi:hypothetical protein
VDSAASETAEGFCLDAVLVRMKGTNRSLILHCKLMRNPVCLENMELGPSNTLLANPKSMSFSDPGISFGFVNTNLPKLVSPCIYPAP